MRKESIQFSSRKNKARSSIISADPTTSEALLTLRKKTGTTLEYTSVQTKIKFQRLVEIESGLHSISAHEVQVLMAFYKKRGKSK